MDDIFQYLIKLSFTITGATVAASDCRKMFQSLHRAPLFVFSNHSSSAHVEFSADGFTLQAHARHIWPNIDSEDTFFLFLLSVCYCPIITNSHSSTFHLPLEHQTPLVPSNDPLWSWLMSITWNSLGKATLTVILASFGGHISFLILQATPSLVEVYKRSLHTPITRVVQKE